MDPYQGVTGKTAFDETGEAVKDVYLLKIAGGRFQEIEDSEWKVVGGEYKIEGLKEELQSNSRNVIDFQP